MKKIMSCLFIAALAVFIAAPSVNAQQVFGAQSVESFNVMGTNSYMSKITVSDTSQLLTTAYDATSPSTAADWTKAKAIWISVESNDIRIAFGRTAVQGGSAIGHILYVGQLIRIPSRSLIKGARIINKTNGSNGVIMVSVEY